MKNKFIKSIAVISLILSSITIIGCGEKTPSTADEENINIKSEGTITDNLIEDNDGIIHLKNENIQEVLSDNVTNADLEKLLINKFGLTDEQAKETRYYYNYVDLNGDSSNEIFAEVVGPYTSGNKGESAVIFRDDNGVLVEMDDFDVIKNPIIISSNKTNGWHDIIFESSVGGTEKTYAVLKYDGEDYSDVDESETINSLDGVSGIAIISNDIANDKDNGKGMYLKK